MSRRVLRSRTSRRTLLKTSAGLGAAAYGLGAGALAMPRSFAQDNTAINVASNASNPEPRARLQKMVDNFNAGDSGFKAEINTTEHEAFKQQIRTMLASDNPPDVLTWFAGNRMRFFSDNGLLMPLDDLYAEQKLEEQLPEGILAVSKGSDGKYYFVPQSYYPWAVWYRPSMFKEMGVEPAKTWEEFLALIDAIKGAGKVPITIGTLAPWTTGGWFDYLNMRQNGPEFHIELLDGKASYTDQAVKDTFGRWRELLDKEAFIPQPEAYSWQDALTPMVQGDAAMFLLGRFIMDQFPDDLEGDIDFFQFPVIDEGVKIGEDAPTDGYFAAAKAANPEGAQALLGYLGGVEAGTTMIEMNGNPAVNTQVPTDSYDEVEKRGLDMLQSADYIAQFYDRDTHPDMAERGMNAFVEFWNNPDDVDGILERLDEERKRVYEAEQ